MAKNVPAKVKSTSVADWNSALKAAAAKQQKAAEVLTSGGSKIGFKGGVLTVAGAQRQGNAANVVVLGVLNERAYYKGPYIEGNMRSPACFAFGELNGGLPEGPHDDAQEPQSERCKGCPNAEWGSAPTGRGQACRQSVRFAALVLPEGKKTVTPEQLEDCEVMVGSVPPTSLAGMKVYLDFLGAQQSPTFAWLTKLEVRPSPKSVFTVHFEPYEALPKNLQGIVLAKLKDADSQLEQPYQPLEEDAAPAKKPGKKRF